jgi:hypothetical protein
MSSNIVTQGCRTVRQCVAAAAPTLARLFRARLRPPCLAYCRNCCLVNRFCHFCPSGEAGPNAWTDSNFAAVALEPSEQRFNFKGALAALGCLAVIFYRTRNDAYPTNLIATFRLLFYHGFVGSSWIIHHGNALRCSLGERCYKLVDDFMRNTFLFHTRFDFSRTVGHCVRQV